MISQKFNISLTYNVITIHHKINYAVCSVNEYHANRNSKYQKIHLFASSSITAILIYYIVKHSIISLKEFYNKNTNLYNTAKLCSIQK